MSALPLRLRVELYVCSLRNIVACAVALLGPLLLFLGVIHSGWLWITAGLYGVGCLLTPAPRVLEADLAQSVPFPALLEQLDRLLQASRSQLQPELLQHLDSIRSSIEEVRPRLAAVHGSEDLLYTVRETVARYLPETLTNYLKLPPLFRATHLLEDGKTARALLLEQLKVLDEQMKEVVTHVACADADALLANGQFLRERFQRRDFLGPVHPG